MRAERNVDYKFDSISKVLTKVQSNSKRLFSLLQRCSAPEGRCIRSAGVRAEHPVPICGAAGAVRGTRAAGTVCQGVSVQTDWHRTVRVSVCPSTCAPAHMETSSIPREAPDRRTATAGRKKKATDSHS